MTAAGPQMIMGIDPGTILMGYGVIQENLPRPVIAFGTLSTPKGAALPVRLNRMFHKIRELIEEHTPDVIAIEQPFFGGPRSFPKAILAVGQAQATVFIAAIDAGIPIFTYTPTQVKLAVTGSGAADKELVKRLVGAQMGLAEGEIKGYDASDALAIAICHMAEFPVAKTLSKKSVPRR